MTYKDEPHNCDYFSPWEKDLLVFVNVYTGKE